MYKLCIRDGTFDFGALAALKTKVSLREAKDIEAVLCADGDNRHTFQTWYGKWISKKKQPAGDRIDGDYFANAAGKGKIDVDVVMRERTANAEMLAVTEDHLQRHRQAVVLGRASHLTLAMVGSLETQLGGLRASQVSIEEQLTEALGELPPLDLTPRTVEHEKG